MPRDAASAVRLGKAEVGMHVTPWCVALALLAASCENPKGAMGPTGEWVKGKFLSVKVLFISPSSVGPRLELDVRNDSNRAVSIVPMRATGWFEQAGRLESAPVPGLLSATFAVHTRDGATHQLKVDPRALNISLDPGETISVGILLYWDAEKVRYDQLKRTRIVLGKDGSEGQEIFTIE